MKPESLKAWRKRHKWTQARAARELGISENGYMAYEKGSSRRRVAGELANVNIRIPKTVALACAALNYGLPPME
jgi:transcriptional regulator with XRE-family HTH domain